MPKGLLRIASVVDRTTFSPAPLRVETEASCATEAKEMLTPGSTECLVQALKATTAKIQSTIFLNTIFFNLNAQVSVDGNSVCCMFPASEVEGEIGAQHLIPQH